MTPEQKRFVEQMATGCKSWEEWKTLVDFGMPTLLKDQEVLVALIVAEAEKQAQRAESGRETTAQCFKWILDQLGLKLVSFGA